MSPIRARSRSRRLGVVGAAVLALGAAGCWPSPGQGPNRDAHNAIEATLTAANVASLTEAWSAPLDGPAFVARNNPSGEIVTGHGGVYVNDAGALYRFDAATGTRDWRRALPDVFPAGHLPEMGQAFVVDDRVLAGYGSYGDVQGLGAEWHSEWLDPDTGAVLDDGPVDAFPVAVRGDRVAGIRSSCGENTFCSSTFVVADVDGGPPLATGSHGLHVNRFFPSTLGTQRLYHSGVDVSAVASRIQAFATTGGAVTPLWSRTLQFRGPATAPVLNGDETVLYTVTGGSTGNGQVQALDAATGNLLWTGDLGAPAFSPAPPALAGGRLYVPTDGGDLVAFDADGCGVALCSPAWRAPTGSDISGQPAVAGGVVYTGSEDGTVAAFDVEGCGGGGATCPPLWSADAGRPVVSPPVVSDAQLYVTTAQVGAGGSGAVVAYALP